MRMPPLSTATNYQQHLYALVAMFESGNGADLVDIGD